MRNSFLLLAFTLSTLSLFSQNKYEREQRINFSELPENCQTIINAFSIPSKIKCYKETQLNGFSYEIKTKVSKQRVSIEFSEKCELEDVEITVDFNSLNEFTKKTINAYLDDNFEKTSILKTQVQLVCSNEEIKQFIKTGIYSDKCLNGFELIVKAKNNEGEFLYELFFDKDGNLQRKEQIITKNTSNLEF
ncbi:MAG: hypothetical protein ACLGGV_01360 [Bacteroidia bacterium]